MGEAILCGNDVGSPCVSVALVGVSFVGVVLLGASLASSLCTGSQTIIEQWGLLWLKLPGRGVQRRGSSSLRVWGLNRSTVQPPSSWSSAWLEQPHLPWHCMNTVTGATSRGTADPKCPWPCPHPGPHRFHRLDDRAGGDGVCQHLRLHRCLHPVRAGPVRGGAVLQQGGEKGWGGTG